MAGSMNRVTLVGTLGRDPEVRTFSNGNKVCNLSLATSESWKDKATGERKEKTEWHKIAIFNDRLVDVAEKYLVKGQLVLIEGQLETRKYTDQAGVEKYTTEIVLRAFGGTMTMLGNKPNTSEPRSTSSRPSRDKTNFGGAGSTIDDEIPF